MRALIAGLALVGLLGGCASQTVAFSAAKPVPADRLYAFQKAEPGLVQVRVTRNQGGVAGAWTLMDILIDGKKAAVIDTGEKVTFYLTPGPHNMGVISKNAPEIFQEHQYIVQAGLPNRYRVLEGPDIQPFSTDD